jgi:hypothetical protein
MAAASRPSPNAPAPDPTPKPSAFRKALRSLRHDELLFLAGVFTARGKMYIGASPRGASVRYVPSLAIEVSHPDDMPLLYDILGAPAERTYYGKPTYRFVVQDKERIGALSELLMPMLPARLASRARAMRDFCHAQDPQEAARHFEAFKRVKDATE